MTYMSLHDFGQGDAMMIEWYLLQWWVIFLSNMHHIK